MRVAVNAIFLCCWVGGGWQSAAGAGPVGGSSIPRVERQERLTIGATTRICVWTDATPRAVADIGRSGEQLSLYGMSGWLGSLLRPELRVRGILEDPPNQRVIVLQTAESINLLCDARDIIVTQSVTARPDGEGYRLVLSAAQGRKIYRASLTRTSTISVSNEMRSMAAADPNVDNPRYWDVRNDMKFLSVAFCSHLLRDIAVDGRRYDCVP